MTTISRYFHTLRHLKPVQFYGRVWFRLRNSQPGLRPAPPRRTAGSWLAAAAREASMIGPARWRLASAELQLDEAGGWQFPQQSELTRYNLHYFDDVNAEGASERRSWHQELISRWIADNPPAQGVGWAPYPTSLRMVNWMKAALSGFALSGEAVHSLAVQARQLERRLEWHLLGNHLFANAKALVFAGCHFDGDEARRWLAKGLSILDRELDEQVLADGGQFELSPMYHALAFEDLLDLINLAGAFDGVIAAATVSRWREAASRMGGWLKVMCHPDGEIAFFNDAAMGVAPTPARLFAYAARLGVSWKARGAELVHLQDSGYIRLQIGSAVLLIDVARIGPDYLPGHAHADTLSFELSLDGQRVLVNSGTSCYGTSPERLRQRGTAAHNTVIAGGLDSSEVWSGFRVARRARPRGLKIERGESRATVECTHDGYCRDRRRLVHRREWRLADGSLEIWDSLEGDPVDGQARFHLHPEIAIDPIGPRREAAPSVRIASVGEGLGVVASSWHPRFGVTLPGQAIVCTVPANQRVGVRFAWRQVDGVIQIEVGRVTDDTTP
jgi:uncharacterized heparinase superfamily protein